MDALEVALEDDEPAVSEICEKLRGAHGQRVVRVRARPEVRRWACREREASGCEMRAPACCEFGTAAGGETRCFERVEQPEQVPRRHVGDEPRDELRAA